MSSNLFEGLTLEKLRQAGKRVIFDTGICEGGPDGINVRSRPGELRWVAVTGDGDDWAVYVAPIDWNAWAVARSGDKVHDINNVKKVVPCDEATAGRYRK